MNYKNRLFIYFFVVFALFAATVVIYQQIRDKEKRTESLQEELDIYSHIVEKDPRSVSLPEDMRITIIQNGGRVLFDNNVDTTVKIENHHNRKEIIEAKKAGKGYDIRTSSTLAKPYFYYARKTADGFIRVALPYDNRTKTLLATDKTFIVLVFVLFILSLSLLWIIARRFGEDIHRLKRRVIKEEKQRIKLKTEMTSAIAHELRTPVSAIRGYAETLMEDGIPNEKKELFINRIYSSAVRLSDLLQDVSLLTKIEEAPGLFKKETINMHNLSSEVVDEFSKAIAANSIKVDNLIPEGTTVQGNNTLLHSVFRNLLENSIRYGGKWITVTISLRGSDDNYDYFSIADNGKGITDGHLPRLFERFYRINDGRSRDDGGSGLGLSIVRHAILQHGGDISAHNLEGGGLEIRFSIAKL